MNPSLQPRLIRPERDGQVGEWSYLFHANGHDYIFPAIVDELGKLKPLIWNEDWESARKNLQESGYWTTKVIYWKASDWETKYLPLAVAWVKRYGWKVPDIPYYAVELRKIEDRDGEERVAEIVNVAAIPEMDDKPFGLIAHQFTEVGGEEGKGHRPLMQWWAQVLIRFENRKPEGNGWSVPNACRRIADWANVPALMKDFIEQHGVLDAFKALTVHGSREGGITDEELRLVTIWLAFCLYINSLKPTGEAVEPTRRRASAPKTIEEAVALEQATILKSAGILKSGVRRRTVATGTGTKHRYRYLVRGHERVINGKSIWIKPQIRGQGEFMVLPLATTPDLQEAIPETPVPVQVPADARSETVPTLDQSPILRPAPKPVIPAKRGLLASLRLLLSSFFLRRW